MARRPVTERFADPARVVAYQRGRPGYPEALFDRLLEISALAPGASVADLGAGTGLATRPLLDRGLRVVAVEPSAEMLSAAETLLGARPGLDLVAGTAEATGLDDASVDLVVAAQAFHWFEPEATRRELGRILRPGGLVGLIWNARRSGGEAFLEAYEALLVEFGTDYLDVGHRGVGEERLATFFRGPFETHVFENRQRLDREDLRARLLSSSYLPAAGEPRHDEMLRVLDAIHERFAVDGSVDLVYDCRLFVGPLS